MSGNLNLVLQVTDQKVKPQLQQAAAVGPLNNAQYAPGENHIMSDPAFCPQAGICK